jgi:hypothetical protein
MGGRLAREVNMAVARRVGNDPGLEALLHRNPNFEEALAELQNAAAISTPGARDQALSGYLIAIREARRRVARSYCRHRIPPFARRLGSKDPQR